MSASPARERRPAIWPYLVMPVIVLLVFCALTRVHRHHSTPALRPAAGSMQSPATGQPAPAER